MVEKMNMAEIVKISTLEISFEALETLLEKRKTRTENSIPQKSAAVTTHKISAPKLISFQANQFKNILEQHINEVTYHLCSKKSWMRKVAYL